jgi:carbon storage regulator
MVDPTTLEWRFPRSFLGSFNGKIPGPASSPWVLVAADVLAVVTSGRASRRTAQGGSAMLVLSRKIGERIQIGDSISVVVLSVRGPNVRLGFAAPPHVRVDREEVHQRLTVEADRVPSSRSG